MKSNRNRTSGEGFFIQISTINGVVQGHLSQRLYYIENIGRGGFRFISDVSFELEDRVQVMLQFPDGHTQEVLGRICYSDLIDGDMIAYGFSVIDGFYALKPSAA